jgi:hypothetical protein
MNVSFALRTAIMVRAARALTKSLQVPARPRYPPRCVPRAWQQKKGSARSIRRDPGFVFSHGR